MDALAAIAARHSVRVYDGRPLSDDDAVALRAFLDQAQPRFSSPARLVLVHDDGDSGEPRKLGNYGTVRGACDFLGLVYRPGAPLADEGAAHLLEQAVLFATTLGLGTVWLAAFKDPDFPALIPLEPGEVLVCASPVGYPADHKPSPAKQPFERLFARAGSDAPLTAEQAGVYGAPLEAARQSPSPLNQQPYRALVDGSVVRFSCLPGGHGGLEHIALGIALCHFELAARQLGVAGGWQVEPDVEVPAGQEYAVSWAA